MAKTKKTYIYASSRQFKTKPAVAGQFLENIRKRDGMIEPEIVVEDSRPVGKGLHDDLEWDNAIAGQLHRIEQAKRVIRSVVVLVEDQDTGKETKEIAYVSVGNMEHKSSYTSMTEALKDDEIMDQIFQDALAQLRGWHKRFGKIKELAEAAVHVKEALDAMPKKVAV